MKRVTLVGTYHEPRGQANSDELHAILTSIKPEVIFLEIPTSAFDYDFQVFRRPNLESRAAVLYRQHHPVAFVPVDSPTPDEGFFSDVVRAVEAVGRSSPRYDKLLERQTRYVCDLGFAYLNSLEYERHSEELDEEAQRTLEASSEPKLLEAFESWKRTHAHREEEWVKRVVSFCAQHQFERGAFLFGAAHRRRMRELSAVETAIQWHLWGAHS